MLSNRGRYLVLAAMIASHLGCKELTQELTGGSSGHSFIVDREFVILNHGFLRREVTWVAVRNWPESSTPDQRLADTRVIVGVQGCCLIRGVDGRATPPDSVPRLYFFDGDTLTTFSIRMKEDDFIGFRPERFKAYTDVLQYFRQYELKP